MKTIITKNLIVLCLISLMLALGACSKFDEGPCISFRSIDARIHGKYKVVYFAKNDIDLTADWNAKCDLEFSFYDSEDTREVETYYRATGFIYLSSGNKYYNGSGRYFVSSSHNSVKLTLNGYIDDIGYPGNDLSPLLMQDYSNNDFEILKLTNSKLWISNEDGYEIHFEE